MAARIDTIVISKLVATDLGSLCSDVFGFGPYNDCKRNIIIFQNKWREMYARVSTVEYGKANSLGRLFGRFFLLYVGASSY